MTNPIITKEEFCKIINQIQEQRKKTEKFSLKVNGKVIAAEYYDPMTDKAQAWQDNKEYSLEKYLGALLTVKR